MDWLILVARTLGTVWEYLVIFLGFIAVTAILIAYLLKKKVTRGQRQLNKLRAQVDELSERLQTIETMTAAVAIELKDSGPFWIPTLTRFKTLITEVEDQIVIEFESRDGKRIFLLMPYLPAAQLVNAAVSVPLQTEAVHPSTLLDDMKPASAFRLPLLTRYEGYFYPGSSTRILCFSTQEGRRIFLPLSAETYETLLLELQSVLASNQQSNGGVVFAFGAPFSTAAPDPERHGP